MSGASLTVPFHGQTLAAVLVDGVPCVAIRPICAALGVDYSSQVKRIRRDAVLGSTVVMTTTVAEDGKQRETFALPLSKLNGWLFGINTSRVRPELRERLTQYRIECFDVLARHFGMAAPAGMSELQARLLDAEMAEKASFQQARVCSHGMNARRKEKPRLAAHIGALRSEVQMVLALIDRGAA